MGQHLAAHNFRIQIGCFSDSVVNSTINVQRWRIHKTPISGEIGNGLWYWVYHVYLIMIVSSFIQCIPLNYIIYIYIHSNPQKDRRVTFESNIVMKITCTHTHIYIHIPIIIAAKCLLSWRSQVDCPADGCGFCQGPKGPLRGL